MDPLSAFSSRVYRFAFSAAAAYNIGFGLWASLFPRQFFEVFHMDPPRYPAIWACLGMVVGLYGVGYAYAARYLDRAFPFIAIGLAGKIFGPIGWVIAVKSGDFPFRTFALIVFDDLIWWLPFAIFLLEGASVTNFLKRNAPYWCAALHVIAAFGTLLLLRTHFRLMWMLWMAAAISLIGFYTWWASRVGTLIPIAIAAAGLTCDFAGESIYIGWRPGPDTHLDRAASLLTGAAGNGLYTLAAIVLTIATPSPPARWLAWLAWASGIALALFTIVDMRMGVVIASAALMTLFIPWVVVMGLKFR